MAAARLSDAELDRLSAAFTISEDWYRSPEGACTAALPPPPTF